jgi:NADH:ubiquinone oxidoreductase subunit E/NAD-dependent dihydropyrimidine dehydrogenase PreA subunit/ferredoxin
MTEIKIVIDDIETSGPEGMTILEAAEKNDIHIPTLCHAPEITSQGVCRVCVVEVEGQMSLPGACHTPIREGMVIHTQSPKVVRTRRANVELLLASHTGPCVNDSNAQNCALHMLASDYEVCPPRFVIEKPRFFPTEISNPYVVRDLSKCILCRKCIGACSEIAGQHLLGIAYRGIKSKLVTGLDTALKEEVCQNCGACIEQCPTGALRPGNKPITAKSGKSGAKKTASTIGSETRAKLLPRLLKAQQKERCLSDQTIQQIAKESAIPVTDVYGVATFYAFLSREALGRNVIRVCKNISCHLHDSEMVIQSVREAIGIGPFETTADKRYSMEITNCIGACDMAPAMMVNDDVHGDLNPDKIRSILQAYS